MAIIYTYPVKSPPVGADKLLMSDSNGGGTKQVTITSILDLLPPQVDSLTAGSGISISGSTGNITIGNTGVLSLTSNFGTYISGTNNAAATGATNIGTVDLNAVDGTAVAATRFLSKDNTWDIPPTYTGGANVGYVPDGGSVGQYLDGTGNWVTASTITGTGTDTLLAVWSGTDSITKYSNLKYTQSTLENSAFIGTFTGLRIRANNLQSTQGWNDELGAANFYNASADTNATQIAINVPAKTGINRAIDFYYNSNQGQGSIGGITVSSSAVAFNTGSDYRLKENVVDMTDAIDRVKQLKPKRFNFIVDPSNTVDGLIAHEAAEVVPEAVSGEKDGDIYQGIDQSKLVPLLIGAIKELTVRIEALEA
jgi:hypothetical protein